MSGMNDRLRAIALYIEQGETMADIGTDHGFLPLFLREKDICPKVIMTDISDKSLQKARENAGTQQPCSNVCFRTGSGLSVIGPGEVDTIVIAGMGGLLITDILSEDTEKTCSFGKFILQPRSNSGRLRHWLFHNDFCFTGDRLVREGRFICEIITASPRSRCTNKDKGWPEPSGEMRAAGSENICWEFPYWLLCSRDPLAEEFLERKIRSERKIAGALGNRKSGNDHCIDKTEKRIEYLLRLEGKNENR